MSAERTLRPQDTPLVLVVELRIPNPATTLFVNSVCLVRMCPCQTHREEVCVCGRFVVEHTLPQNSGALF